jgi:hypothetical protein
MNELLKILAEHDRELEAPAAVELRLKAAFRKKYRTIVWPYFAFAAAAAAVVVFYVYPRPKAETMEIAISTPAVPVLPVTRSVRRRAAHRKQPKEVMTEFFSLLDDAPPIDRGQLWRVKVTAATMRTVGLPVSEEHLSDRVQADVLVGEEGLARAIRFVKYEQ